MVTIKKFFKKTRSFTVMAAVLVACIVLGTTTISAAWWKKDKENTTQERTLKDSLVKFDFGSGSVLDGYTKITNNSMYDPKLGYGLVSNDGITMKNSNPSDSLKGDGLVGRNVGFNLDLPKGTYNVTVISENNNKDLTITAEGNVIFKGTTARAFLEKVFEVEVSDGQLNLAFSGDPATVNVLEVSKILKFEFGKAKAAPGYISVPAKTVYDAKKGYGFSDPSKMNDGESMFSPKDPLARSFAIFTEGGADSSCSFKVDVPAGRYEVSILTGENSNLNRINLYVNGVMELYSVDTGAGICERESFITTIAAGQMKITVTGRQQPFSLDAMEIKKIADNTEVKKTIYIAGDSTVCSYHTVQRPQAGWGELLPKFVSPDIIVRNYAEGGLSAKSFLNGEAFPAVMHEIHPGDYFLIGFGINDSNRKDPNRYADPGEEFKNILRQYIDKAREKGAIPILITTQGRSNRFTNDNPPVHSVANSYAASMRELAVEKQVQLIDLEKKSSAYYTSIGPEKTQLLYKEDNLHFNYDGATQLARIVAEEGKSLGLPW